MGTAEGRRLLLHYERRTTGDWQRTSYTVVLAAFRRGFFGSDLRAAWARLESGAIVSIPFGAREHFRLTPATNSDKIKDSSK